ncbi:unnamed protein product, partial [Mesorhabditis belari]|uniref:Nose resistant-to-fluoxetine protein N-terminal domain-containing protein n=1 Tax=Mesorhabditis belari TaxID=2138241 RepID=A0AAF3F5X9_9BILA
MTNRISLFIGIIVYVNGQLFDAFPKNPRSLWARDEIENQEIMKQSVKSFEMKDWLFRVMKRAVNENSVNIACMEDLTDLEESFRRIESALTKKNVSMTDFDKKVTIQVIDSNGAYNGGFLRGRKVFQGRFDECRLIKYKAPNRSHTWEGDVFRYFIGQQDGNKCKDGTVLVAFDQCLPKSCSVSELRKLLEKEEQICVVVNNEYARVNKANWFSWFLGILMAIIVVVSVFAGVVDYFLSNHIKGTSIEKLLWYRLFMAFSLSSNVKGIMNVKGTNKPGQIGSLHCMRFFSMVWVIMGHMNSNVVGAASNVLDILDASKAAQFYILSNSFFSVDTFFFIGGVLLAYMWFKEFKKDRRTMMSSKGWLMFYVHRILRLSPPYYFAFFFWSYIFLPNLPDSSNNLYYSGDDEDPCRKFWWPAMLYVQNLVHYTKNQCYGISWYLAADMQMYVFSPILLIALGMNVHLGLSVAGVILFLSTSGNIATIYKFRYPPTIAVFDKPDPKMTNYDNYGFLIYQSAWIRCQIYVIGILVGYFLQMKKSIKINKYLNLGLLFATFAFMLFDVMILHAVPRDKVMPLFWRSIYSAFSKPLWGLCLSWITISCYYGYGGK